MIINDKREVTTVKFGEIREGECFIFPEDNSVCMKIEATAYCDEVTAVDLANGSVFEVRNETAVIKVKSRMEIW